MKDIQNHSTMEGLFQFQIGYQIWSTCKNSTRRCTHWSRLMCFKDELNYYKGKQLSTSQIRHSIHQNAGKIKTTNQKWELARCKTMDQAAKLETRPKNPWIWSRYIKINNTQYTKSQISTKHRSPKTRDWWNSTNTHPPKNGSFKIRQQIR